MTGQDTATVRSLSDEVDRVAHIMCLEMGHDPDAQVGCDKFDTMSPHEHFQYYRDYHAPPLTGSPPYEDMSGRQMFVPRWRSYRRVAAEALFGWRAVNRFIMTEK